MGEIEQCIEETQAFYQCSVIMQSPHALRQVKKLLVVLDREGYGAVPTVRDLKAEVQSHASDH